MTHSATIRVFSRAFSIDDTRVSGTATNIADLRASRPGYLPAVQVLSDANGNLGVFRWDAASLAADNGATVVKPDGVESSAAGRWLRTPIKVAAADVSDSTSAGRSILTAVDASAQRTALALHPGVDVQAYDAELAALAGLASAANKVPYFTAPGVASLADSTAYGRSLWNADDAAAARSALDLVQTETSIASAATTNLGSIAGLGARITGTTTITSFGTTPNILRFVRFASSLTLTHNATSLILPGAADIVTAAGDTCIAASDASGNWRVWAYQRAGFPYAGGVSIRYLDEFGTSGAVQWPAAINWLNGGSFRALVVSGNTSLPDTDLPAIAQSNVGIFGLPGSRITKPSTAGTSGLIFKIGNGVESSATRVFLKGFTLNIANWATANGAAFMLDGANDVEIDIPHASNLVQFLSIGPTADVFSKRIFVRLNGGNWHAERNHHFIHHKRGNNINIERCHCTSTLGGTGYSYFLEAYDGSAGVSDGNNDGLYVNKFEVWSPGQLSSIVVMDSTNGQIVNQRWQGTAFDSTNDAAFVIRATGGTSRVGKIYVLNTRSTPDSGQVYRIINNGGGLFEQIDLDFVCIARDEHVGEWEGSGWFENCRAKNTIGYVGPTSPVVESLVKVGVPNVRLDIVCGPGGGSSGIESYPGRSAYNYVLEITSAAAKNIHASILDNGADIGLVKHPTYSGGGGENIVINGKRYIVDVSAGRTLTARESGAEFTNAGATAQVNFTLPGAEKGMEFTFYVADADGLRVTAAAGDTIRIGASVSAAAGNATSTTVGSSVRLKAINATEWVALSSVGSWTVT